MIERRRPCGWNAPIPISGSRLIRRPINAFFSRLQMIGANRLNDLSKAAGDVDEVVAAVAIASPLDRDTTLDVMAELLTRAREPLGRTPMTFH